MNGSVHIVSTVHHHMMPVLCVLMQALPWPPAFVCWAVHIYFLAKRASLQPLEAMRGPAPLSWLLRRIIGCVVEMVGTKLFIQGAARSSKGGGNSTSLYGRVEGRIDRTTFLRYRCRREDASCAAEGAVSYSAVPPSNCSRPDALCAALCCVPLIPRGRRMPAPYKNCVSAQPTGGRQVNHIGTWAVVLREHTDARDEAKSRSSSCVLYAIILNVDSHLK